MFRILVPIKRVPDPAAKLHLSNGQPVLAGVRMVLNPYDEVALEEAVRWREAGQCDEVIALNVGDACGDETLRQAIALGANRAIRIEAYAVETPFSVAQNIAACAKELAVQMIICGMQSSDEESGQVGPMLAALLDWPLAAAATRLHQEHHGLQAHCRQADGIDQIDLPLPAVVTADLQLNTPRYARLPAIVAAKRHRIEILPRASSLPAAPLTTHFDPPPSRPPIRMIENADDLAEIIVRELGAER